jgi:hypothetical protein
LHSEVNDGLVLISDFTTESVVLIDIDNNIVNSWEVNDYNLLNSYLTPDSILVTISKLNNLPVLQKYDWDGLLLWTFILEEGECIMHHEQVILPNGNILAICKETIIAEENIYFNEDIVIDKIIEIEPLDHDQANIIWEWRFYDHLIQDYDPNMLNYGIISENPQLLNINAYNVLGDFTHLNCVDFNAELNQIVFSSRTLNEVFIIDHSTTTEEAKSHIGGIYGKGGDFLYRWGNPINYNRGDLGDQKLHAPHAVNWINSDYPGGGNILLFDNEYDVSISAIIEFQPPILSNGLYSLDANEPFAPNEYTWINYSSDYFSLSHSGAFRMPNGNTLITIFGVPPLYEINIIEIDENGSLQWEYLGSFVTFRASKYPLSYFNSMVQIGDINEDGLLNILDIVILVNCALQIGYGYECYNELGDTNLDGVINILDVVILINIILNP